MGQDFISTDLFLFHMGQQNEMLRDIQNNVRATNGRVGVLETNQATLTERVDNNIEAAKDGKARWLAFAGLILTVVIEAGKSLFR